VQFFDTLQAVDTSTPTQSPETHTHLRNDEVHLSMSTSDALLACSPQKVIAHQIAVAAVM
jgi:Asp-tRNA(Asn)/Glu-tRNA(Gln) amidotransferase C subunit